jgi:hypothetical protein
MSHFKSKARNDFRLVRKALGNQDRMKPLTLVPAIQVVNVKEKFLKEIRKSMNAQMIRIRNNLIGLER